MITIIVIIISIMYCEIIWRFTKIAAGKYIQHLMLFFMILNYFIGIFTQAQGNIIFETIITLYYFVIIPKRLLN